MVEYYTRVEKIENLGSVYEIDSYHYTLKSYFTSEIIYGHISKISDETILVIELSDYYGCMDSCFWDFLELDKRHRIDIE